MVDITWCQETLVPLESLFDNNCISKITHLKRSYFSNWALLLKYSPGNGTRFHSKMFFGRVGGPHLFLLQIHPLWQRNSWMMSSQCQMNFCMETMLNNGGYVLAQCHTKRWYISSSTAPTNEIHHYQVRKALTQHLHQNKSADNWCTT